MSTIQSSDEHLTLNASGSAKEIKLQANGVEKAKVTSTGIDVTGRITTDGITEDSSGNVGIGTSSPSHTLELGALDTLAVQTGSTVFDLTPTAGAKDTAVWDTSNNGSEFAWNTNGTERMRIDSSGCVTMPYQPFFSAYHGSSIGWSNGSTVPFTSIHSQQGNNYNTSTSTFTAPVAGVYLFTVRAMASAGFGQFFWYLNVNNSNVGYIATTPGLSQFDSIQGTREVKLQAGDSVKIVGSGSHSGLYATWYDNNFTGYLLG